LATLYYSTGGNDWNESSFGWMTGTNECSWYGILCDDQNLIADIELRQKNLAGPLPLELHMLSNSLTDISLNSNSISGAIPSTFGLLTKLGKFCGIGCLSRESQQDLTNLHSALF
jgi:hypothetical protein